MNPGADCARSILTRIYDAAMVGRRCCLAVGVVLLLAGACGDDDDMMQPQMDAALDTGPSLCTSDRECDDDLFCNGTEECAPDDPNADELGCVADVAPCDDCDEEADVCPMCPDADGDGAFDARCGGDDCDDSDPNSFPGNIEVCGGRDNHDEDCDPTTFGMDGDRDADGEISALCCNGGGCGGDCNDNDVSVFSGQLELCDEIDNDCDGLVDEQENEVAWYPDRDSDLYGDPNGEQVVSCTPVPGHTVNAFDCDDTRATVGPGRVERCNGLDDDCDESIDENVPDCSPCDPDPCWNGAVCEGRGPAEYFCRCPTGFTGPECQSSCDVEPAFTGTPGDADVNHVRGAALFMSSQRDDGMIVTCDGPCGSHFAADGQRCGDTTRSPVAFSALTDVGQSWRADWSANGAKRIDRIEIYAVRGPEAAGLHGAEIFVDDFMVATYPSDEGQAAFVFDPPLYGNSVEIRKTSDTNLLGVAEVEVWGAEESPVADVAFLGAVRQSSNRAAIESVNQGGTVSTSPMFAVDGRADTAAQTKAFSRAGSLDLEAQIYPFNTGNQDEAPLVGVNAAWWYLELGRPQVVRSLQIHRGVDPTLLDGAMVYLVIDGTIETEPRWTLPTGGDATERLRPATPVQGVTGVKIVSAIEATPAPGDAAAALDIREVRVWADRPSVGAESLRDLSAFARIDSRQDVRDGTGIETSGFIDGDVSVIASTRPTGSTFVRLTLERPHELVRLDMYHRTEYPGTFLFSPPGSGCPSRPLCGDTYGGCSFQPYGGQIIEIDGNLAQVGEPLGTIGFNHFETVTVDRAQSVGVELTKPALVFFPSAVCPTPGYQTVPILSFADLRLIGYWGDSGAEPLNYAAGFRAASVSHSPAEPGAGPRANAYRAFNLYDGDAQATSGVGAQELVVHFHRPVAAEEIEILGDSTAGVSEGRLEVLVDGGLWERVTTLPARTDHTIALPSQRLIHAVRIRKTDSLISVRELRVLGAARY